MRRDRIVRALALAVLLAFLFARALRTRVWVDPCSPEDADASLVASATAPAPAPGVQHSLPSFRFHAPLDIPIFTPPAVQRVPAIESLAVRDDAPPPPSPLVARGRRLPLRC